MNKEEILKKSQQENEGRLDERELAAYSQASRIGMLVGGLLCICLVLVSELLWDRSELALIGWMIYFSMQGTHNLVLYCTLKKRFSLAVGILDVVFAVSFAVAITILVMR